MIEVALREANLLNILQVCFDLQADEREQAEAIRGELFNPEAYAASLYALDGPRWAILDSEDNALVVCGATSPRPGVWDIWYLARPVAWEEYGEAVTDITRGLIQSMFYDYEAHRLTVVCLEKRATARRWYERHLGLNFEGVMNKFCANGENAVLYSIVRN